MSKRTLLVSLFTVLLVGGCGPQEQETVDLGVLTDIKGDFTQISNVPWTASAGGESSIFTIQASSSFRLVVKQTTNRQISVLAGGSESERDTELDFRVTVATASEIEIKILNHGSGKADGTFSLIPVQADPQEMLLAAAHENLTRIAKEVDPYHIGVYDLEGSIADQFLEALQREYADHPGQLQARTSALASAVIFAAPEVAPPAAGKTTPFHGMDMDDFNALMDIHDDVFDYLQQEKNDGELAGVRPFSVCETRYQIEKYVKAGKTYNDFESYRDGYAAYAASCSAKDLAEWYNYRGLGHMRPSWMEANIMERFVRRMVKECDVQNDPAWADECAEWNDGRLAYRLDRNRQLASRFMFYHPDQADSFSDPDDSAVLVEDMNGDGIGEYLLEGKVDFLSGDEGTLQINSSGEFSGRLKAKKGSGSYKSVKLSDLVANDTIDPEFEPAWLQQPDFGLMTRFSDSEGCTGEEISPHQCPLLKRFYVMIDRHENFYSTYSALSRTSYLSSQPSPLVACSITLRESHHWDSAGTPSGGRAGFIYLFRVPFSQILAGKRKSVATLEGPEVLAIQDLYDGSKTLDMSKVWLDIASLSNNLYSSEHEISKFGIVPAEQIEGLLVIRKPKAMDN